VHRDIKPANLLLDKHRKLKLIDFGISRELLESEVNFTHTLNVSVQWAPYEVFLNHPDRTIPYSKTNDFYSLGLLCYYLVTTNVDWGNHGDQFVHYFLEVEGELEKRLCVFEDSFRNYNAAHLIRNLVDKDYRNYRAFCFLEVPYTPTRLHERVLTHPFFWSDEKVA
jgi:serine/threonine protein kinase